MSGKVMTLDEALTQRRSVRGFEAREVPDALIRDVFELAQAAPSNCNIQPWLCHVVSGDTLRAIAEKMVAASIAGVQPDPDFTSDRKFTGVYRDRQVDAAVQLYGAMGIERNDRPKREWAYRRNLEFFGAPHAVLVFMYSAFEEREAVDLGIYAQTLMLALTSRGLASCAQGALSLYPTIIREHLGLSADNRLIFGISFGYEDESVPANSARVGRSALGDAVVFHR